MGMQGWHDGKNGVAISQTLLAGTPAGCLGTWETPGEESRVQCWAQSTSAKVRAGKSPCNEAMPSKPIDWKIRNTGKFTASVVPLATGRNRAGALRKWQDRQMNGPTGL